MNGVKTQIQIKKKKGGKKMELQSVFSQRAGLTVTNSSENNLGSQKTEGKRTVAFQEYMSSATKKKEPIVSSEQKTGNECNMTSDTALRKDEKVIKISDDVSTEGNETSEEEVITQEVQFPQEEDHNNLESLCISENVVCEWKEEVQEVLCEEFDLTLEELENIMSELGLQFADLQNLSNIQQFVLNVAGTDDKTALLTNEVLAKQVISVQETLKQITSVFMQEYGLNNEEITNYLVQATQQENMESIVIVEDVLTEETTSQQETDWQDVISKGSTNEGLNVFDETSKDKAEYKFDDIKVSEEGLVQEKKAVETELGTGMVSKEESYESNMKNPEISVEKEVVSTNKEIGEEKAETKVEITVENEDGNQPREEEFSNSGKEENPRGLFEHFVENLSINRTVNTEKVDIRMDAITQMREIVTQVVEQIKVKVNADTSSMEVQLNPESLGKVNLTVVAREGHITAQFVTENELARQALEGQVQQLRENLGEQGLKVDEVEVTVSNFDFSHSNQANAEEQRQQQSQEQKRVNRNLNLKDAVSLKDLTEEEQLAARIMADNGNQIDYTA